MRGFAFAGVLGVVLALPSAMLAQQFDNFGDGPLEGFELSTEVPDDVVVPSITDDTGLPADGDVTLRTTDGQSGVELNSFPGAGSPITSISQPATTQGQQVTLRALDKTLGRPTDVAMAVGETVVFGRIAIQLVECRFPSTDPSSDAFAHLVVYDLEGSPMFDGWMVASSPSLSALEHPRYDVWVLRCTG